MGLASVGASPAVFSPGELESDPEATPPAGRRAVHYGSPGEDALFEDDAAAADEDPEAASSVLEGPSTTSASLLASTIRSASAPSRRRFRIGLYQ